MQLYREVVPHDCEKHTQISTAVDKHAA